MERLCTLGSLTGTESESSRVLCDCKKPVTRRVDRKTCHLLVAISVARNTRNDQVVVGAGSRIPDRHSTFPQVGLVEEVTGFVKDCVFGIEILDIDVVGVGDGRAGVKGKRKG